MVGRILLLLWPLSLCSCVDVVTATGPVAPASSTKVACQAPDRDGCALGMAADGVAAAEDARAVTGAPLAMCSLDPLTGVVRDGRCRTGVDDVGAHTVCGEVTDAFLAYTKARGNDLVTARGAFPGLKPGDHWCLCEARVQEAVVDGIAVGVVLEATNAAALRTLPRDTLERLATKKIVTKTVTDAAR